MRYTLRDVVKPDPNNKDSFTERVSGWWLEWPLRHYVFTRWWWHQLLRAPGSGWLRWGLGTGVADQGWYEPPEHYTVAPPLRRLVESAQTLVVVRSWREARAVWRVLTDHERREELWS